MTPVSIRDATPDDSEAIARIARASWAETYRDIFEPAFIAEFLDANYQPASLAGRPSALPDGRTATSSSPSGTATSSRSPSSASGSRGPELFRIYADPAHFGTGAGSALLDELHRRLAGRVDAYVVEVHSKNARGRTFYDRQGFVIVGDGTLVPGGDLVLRRTLTPERPALPVETERLRLRSLDDDDAERLFEIYGDAETMRYVGRTGRPIADLDATARAVEAIRAPRRRPTGSGCGRSTSARASRSSAWPAWRGSRGTGRTSRPPTSSGATDGDAATRPRRCEPCSRSGTSSSGWSGSSRWRIRENDASRRVMEKAGMRPDGTVEAYGRTMTRHVSSR